MTLKRFFAFLILFVLALSPVAHSATAPAESTMTVGLTVTQKSAAGGGLSTIRPVNQNQVSEPDEEEDEVLPGEITCLTDDGQPCPGFLPPEEFETGGDDFTAGLSDVVVDDDTPGEDLPPPVIDLSETPTEIIQDAIDIVDNFIEQTTDSIIEASSESVEAIRDFVAGSIDTITEISINLLDGAQNAIQAFVDNPVMSIVNASVLITEATDKFVNSPAGQVIMGVAKPLGVAAGAAFVTMQAIVGTGLMTVTSLSDIYLLLWKLVGILVGSSKRRGRPWGTVYDSITKRPLDPAYVVAYKNIGGEIADAITDLDGRYGFFIPAGIYKLKASKTNYSFPSKILEGKNSDEIYNNIYHGEDLSVGEGEVLVENIPMDPVGFDWNEFAKNKQNLFRIYSDRERFWNRIFDGIYFVGLLSAFIATIFDPKVSNFVFVAIYATFIAYSFVRKGKRKAVTVKNPQTNMPIPFAVIKVFFAETNNQIKTVVADHLGRFYFLVGPGKYYVTVDEKMLDGTYKTIYKSGPMELKHGVLSGDILV